MSGPRRLLDSLFACDLRALAAFRIALALCLFADIGQRAMSLRAHYTDAGVLPRAELLHYFAWLHEWPLVAHLLGGSTPFVAALFAIHALAALALLLGYRTPLAALLAWWLTSSVQLRNLYIGGGFDALLRMLLLWAVFLPLGARWSVQAGPARQPAQGGESHLSIATVALFLQVAIVYFAAGLAKAEGDLWWSGGALELVLNDEMFTTAFGAWLAHLPVFCRAATWSVLAIELLGPAMLILSGLWPLARVAVVAVLLAMNLGFAMALAVGPFPWIMSAALLAFLPAGVWQWGERVVQQPRWQTSRLPAWWNDATGRVGAWLGSGEGGPTAATRRPAWQQVVCAVLLVYVVGWNFAVARDPGVEAPPGLRWVGHGLFLQQNWRMFASPSTLTGWIVVPGQLADGSEVDLLAAGGPVPSARRLRPVSWQRPSSIVGQTADVRWRLLLRRVVGEPDARASPQQYGSYLCREWNRRYPEGRWLQSFAFVRVFSKLTPPYAERSYERQTVWQHECFPK